MACLLIKILTKQKWRRLEGDVTRFCHFENEFLPFDHIVIKLSCWWSVASAVRLGR